MAAPILGWHAHVYYDAATRPTAEAVRAGLAEALPELTLGRWHDMPVGPHPRGSFQAAFGPERIGAALSWLVQHRQGLAVLIHAETGDDRADHTAHAVWLGEMLDLDLSALR